MTKFNKLLQKIKDEKEITFEEAEKVLLFYGFIKHAPQSGSSHVTFTKDKTKAVTLVRTQKPLKKYLIKLIKEAING